MVRESLKNNEIYLLTKYNKSVLWGVAECLSCIWDAWCLKVKHEFYDGHPPMCSIFSRIFVIAQSNVNFL